MLRILHVIGIMSRGGAETLLMNLYRKMDREMIQFDFVVHSSQKGDYDDEIRTLGGKIYYMPHYNGANHFSYVMEWNRFFCAHPEYSIVHGHIRSTASIYLKTAKKFGRTAIAHSHGTSSRGNWLDKFVKMVMQYPIRHTADYFFACSQNAGIWLFGRKICQGSRFFILNNAIDSSQFLFSEDLRNKKRMELGIGQQFVIGHIGNFDAVKNHAFLIDIFSNICEKDKNCLLLLIGGGNPKLRNTVEQKVCQKKLTDKVKFLGKRMDVNELLNAFDVFVFPSLHEGLGIAAIEAQANGLKCILSDTIPQETAVSDNVTFVSLDKPAELWANLVLAHKGIYVRENMAQNIFIAGYDIKKAAEWLSEFYFKL